MTTSTAKWQAPERTVAAKAVFEKAEADLSTNPDSYRLEPESVVRLLETTGVLEKIGENDWQDALEVFMSSARDDANLNALGKRSAIGSAFARLNARASMNTWYEHNAPSGLPRTQAPIFIIGGWRTGTTLLQRLLASAPGLRGLYPYELSAPWKVAGADESARNKLAAGAAKAHERLHFLNSRIQSIHDSGADKPEECVLALGSHLRNWGFLSTMRLQSYATWLASQSLASEYQSYGDQLAMLDQRDGQRFLLKAPAHTAELEHLFDAFPDATVIHLHRNVVETVASGASLFATFRATYCDDVDPTDVGEFLLWQTALWFERAMAYRENCSEERRQQFIDVSYREMVADPLGVAQKILTAAGVAEVENTHSALAEYLANNQKGKHGTHRYGLEEFGLEEGVVNERLSDYRRQFGV